MTAFVDTNVLLYAVGQATEERRKRAIARDLLDRDDLAYSTQVMNEFIWQATRTHKGPCLSIDIAMAFIDKWSEIAVQDLTKVIFDAARQFANQLNYNWWDCLIVAAARAQGCDILYTEDMQDGRIIDGLRIVDPFRDL